MPCVALRSSAEQGFRSTREHGIYVYLLRSKSHPEQRYVGVTTDLKKRLQEHNAARSPHTSKYAPWVLVVAVCFADRQRAEAFECYLKQGSRTHIPDVTVADGLKGKP